MKNNKLTYLSIVNVIFICVAIVAVFFVDRYCLKKISISKQSVILAEESGFINDIIRVLMKAPASDVSALKETIYTAQTKISNKNQSLLNEQESINKKINRMQLLLISAMLISIGISIAVVFTRRASKT
jgi:hypothetical protein